VVLDLNLPRGSGLELLREIRTLHPPARALVLSEEENSTLVHRAFRAGAYAYLSKRDEAAELLSAIEAMLAGRRYASSRVSAGLLDSLADGEDEQQSHEVEGLSDRELHVFRLLGRKCGATAVARELGVSVKTIETHQGRIKQKLKLRSCEDLRRRAEQWIMALDSRLPKRGKRTNGRSATHEGLSAR
jgi:DNA-binding NarL/FixJ family response regulator